MSAAVTFIRKNVITITGLTILIILAAIGAASGIFSSQERLEQFLAQAGVLAPGIFLLIQIIQVIIPILPGGVTCLIGVVVFGPVWGFVYNYAGLVIGSIISFLLIRKYGRALILKLVSEKNYNKYIGWLEKGKKFQILFAAAIFLPGFPDDVLCMLAGLSGMSFGRFTLIMLLCRPISLIGYSVGFNAFTALF
ncbi:MAG TPA: TVP38/TMEM64 family protein [Candidatus Scybalocola faecigallinarum]|uniref:TVP38/TMEM64 family membrane protein n=1 Tax=Candidatus Scybalocola faecigallinarum TaxID=2840941 RepID=A0A9D1F1R9_9FIRM|nr:TVP38/TMEM64 family protein [Candidatus Scybalocola faecigallinarum]